MARYIFITGGVVSSLGKGLASAALGALLQARGYGVRLRKLASSFVLLETRIDPNRLEMDSAVRKNALGELFEFVREIETLG